MFIFHIGIFFSKVSSNLLLIYKNGSFAVLLSGKSSLCFLQTRPSPDPCSVYTLSLCLTDFYNNVFSSSKSKFSFIDFLLYFVLFCDVLKDS